MRNPRDIARDRRKPTSPDTQVEWIGGVLSPPFRISDPNEPDRLDLIVWLEVPSDLIVGQELIDPRQPDGALSRVLRNALARPLAGPRRTPDTIRVADARLVKEVRRAVGPAIPITVAPTPELDELLQLMMDSFGEEAFDASYFGDGTVPEEVVRQLFAAARVLGHGFPWEIAADIEPIRVDIPGLGVDGACLSIIGQMGRSPGILVFSSLDDFETFLRTALQPENTREFDPAIGWLALNLDRLEDLSPTMKHEAATHGWPVAGPDAYPSVERLGFAGEPQPIVERDVRIAVSCANALSLFVRKHRSQFGAALITPMCESYFDSDDLEVRLTMPYEAHSRFAIDDDAIRQAPVVAVPRSNVSRNDPCPCGSGRKYKKCHLVAEREAQPVPNRGDAHHDLDGQMVPKLMKFARTHFGAEWGEFEKDFYDIVEAVSLAVPWSLYQFEVRGSTVAAQFLEHRKQHLRPGEQAWLEAQGAAWLSVWEVNDVDPGESIMLTDMLSGEVRNVREVSASETLVPRDAILARIVDINDTSLLCGVHPRPLPPRDAAEVVRRARGRLRRRRNVPTDRLRVPAFGSYLIRRWEDFVAGLDARQAMPLDLRNTDGDSLILTVDHFDLTAGARSAVEAKLAALEDVEGPDDEGRTSMFTFSRPTRPTDAGLEQTLIGAVRVTDRRLTIDTNSRERADTLRGRVEVACGADIRHRIREHQDPQSPQARQSGPVPAQEPQPPELQAALLEFKRRHYADWPDHALPALGGQSPREAVRTAVGRSAVDVLLKEMENHEQRMSEGVPFDFSGIRRELRLE